ncbi:MAG: type IV toxin-antitoxin system AbiEi family antitoxin domain-containing protein [Kiritimatiellae bacterium]|nr:type IV toxin-antitoxin system AbiEi family antitoxin domain-containing protein [Kiritimatiellia bacterium]
MNSEIRAKVKNVHGTIPENGVAVSSYLLSKGYTYEQLYGYKKSGWIDEFGHGAYCKHGQCPSIESAIDALCHQVGLPLRIGARSALTFDGFVHFIPMHRQQMHLYLKRGITLPKWFSKKFSREYTLSTTGFIDIEDGISEQPTNGFSCLRSDPERAILELLNLVPYKVQVAECYQLLEMMTNLRVSVLQKLLTHCSSVKAKRLFLMLAEAAGHPWFKRLDTSDVDLGSGCRMIDKGGSLETKYGVVVKPWRTI